MASLNKIMLLGNLGQDPEMRYTPGGQPTTQISLATSRNYKKNEEWVEETEWHRIVLWGPIAERAAEQLRKGSQAYFEGRIQTRKWEDKAGQTRYTTEVIASDFKNLTKRNGDAAAGGSEGGYAPAADRKRPAADFEPDLDDLPF